MYVHLCVCVYVCVHMYILFLNVYNIVCLPWHNDASKSANTYIEEIEGRVALWATHLDEPHFKAILT